jgi:hypothetical protein
MRTYKFPILFFALVISLIVSCKKTDYLDINAGDRPALSAKVKFINARQSVTAVNFWDFTRKVTATPLQRNTATGYLDTQFGKVQFNLTEGTESSYKASYIFGGVQTLYRKAIRHHLLVRMGLLLILHTVCLR